MRDVATFGGLEARRCRVAGACVQQEMRVYTYIYINIHIYIYIYIIHKCVFGHVYIYKYLYMYMCRYICMYTYLRVHTFKQTHPHTHTHTHTHLQASRRELYEQSHLTLFAEAAELTAETLSRNSMRSPSLKLGTPESRVVYK